jgi:hypothetical protein
LMRSTRVNRFRLRAPGSGASRRPAAAPAPRRRMFSALACWRGTKRRNAAKARPRASTPGVSTATDKAAALVGPICGMLISRRQLASACTAVVRAALAP